MAFLVAESSRVDPGARVANDAIIGPGCVIGPDVEIERGARYGATRLNEPEAGDGAF